MGKSCSDKIWLKLLFANRLSADVFERHLRASNYKALLSVLNDDNVAANYIVPESEREV